MNFKTLTPEEYKKSQERELDYSIRLTPFGECLLAFNGQRICYFSFIHDRGEALGELLKTWWGAHLSENREKTGEIIEKIFYSFSGGEGGSIPLLLKGTEFQLKVWEALLAIPKGSVVCYQELAASIGSPNAVRAVAGAVARNSIAVLIPCHRVIAKNGKIHHYRWGADRKKALLQWEGAPV